MWIANKFQVKSISIFFLIEILLLSLLSGCGSGGASNGDNKKNTDIISEINAPVLDPPIVLAGEQTTITISAFIPGSNVELYRVDDSNTVKIGDMTDDGKNGDQIANDNIYTIQTTVNESNTDTINLKILASINNKQVNREISIPIVSILSLESDTEINQAMDELYTKALDIKNIFMNYQDQPLIFYKDIGDDLLIMFSNFEAITKQDVGFALFGMGKEVKSCDQLLTILDENPNDSRVSEFKNNIIAASNGEITEDMFEDPLWKMFAIEYARKYLIAGKIKSTSGCEGGFTEKIGKFAIKTEITQFTSLAGESIGKLFDLGTLTVKALNEGIGTLVGWFIDKNGDGNILVGKTTNDETFEAAVGTHNFYYSFGGDTPKAIVKNVLVTPQQTTSVNFSPGIITGGYSISGLITSGGAGLTDVTVKLSGPETGTKITDSNGQYNFTNLAIGTHTITPVKVDYAFIPSDITLTVNNVNITGKDFVATTGGSIAGTITSGSIALTDVTVTLSGAGSASTTTDSNGNYQFTGIANGLYTITPSESGYSFSPSNRSININDNNTNITSQNFVGTIVNIVTWAKTYNNESNNGSPTDIHQTSDGGYIVLGLTSLSGYASDIMILKLDSNGDIQWQKTYGGYASESARSVQQTSDGGYIVVGSTESFNRGYWGDNNIWILKLDPNGDIQWQRTHDWGNDDGASSVQQTSDGGYIVAGYLGGSCKIWILKLDPNGDIQWQKAYRDWSCASPSSIQQTSDDGYIVAGFIQSYLLGGISNFDIWILKLDSNGDIQWQKAYGGVESEFNPSVQQTLDGGYIVAGGTYAGSGISDIWILKLDSNGDIQWQKAYGGNNYTFASSVQQTSDGGYIVAGYASPFSGSDGSEGWLLKLDSSGNIRWQKTYSMSNAQSEFTLSARRTIDEGYIVTGKTFSLSSSSWDIWILKLDPNGDILGCAADLIGTSNSIIIDTSVSGTDTNASVQDIYPIHKESNAIPINVSGTNSIICIGD